MIYLFLDLFWPQKSILIIWILHRLICSSCVEFTIKVIVFRIGDLQFWATGTYVD